MKEGLRNALVNACRINLGHMWELGIQDAEERIQAKNRFVGAAYEDMVSVGEEEEARKIVSENIDKIKTSINPRYYHAK